MVEVIHKVGLSGYEEAYPRELSGGMKQCVGLARALGFMPEILCMDEAFSALDPLTAEGLRAEVLDIWRDRETNPKTVFMVSHDIREVVFMADRIVIDMGANPAHPRSVLSNTIGARAIIARRPSYASWTACMTSLRKRICPTPRRPCRPA